VDSPVQIAVSLIALQHALTAIVTPLMELALAILDGLELLVRVLQLHAPTIVAEMDHAHVVSAHAILDGPELIVVALLLIASLIIVVTEKEPVLAIVVPVIPDLPELIVLVILARFLRVNHVLEKVPAFVMEPVHANMDTMGQIVVEFVHMTNVVSVTETVQLVLGVTILQILARSLTRAEFAAERTLPVQDAMEFLTVAKSLIAVESVMEMDRAARPRFDATNVVHVLRAIHTFVIGAILLVRAIQLPTRLLSVQTLHLPVLFRVKPKFLQSSHRILLTVIRERSLEVSAVL